jgi:hypothetical protein
MEIISQELDDILEGLQELTVDWRDETANRVVEKLRNLIVKKKYSIDDVKSILDHDFDEGLLICRLFLALSKDKFELEFRAIRGSKGIGVASYRAHPEEFLFDLKSIGLLEAMALEANRETHWSDILIERLRSGRGSAVAGQKRGRGVEDFVESIVSKVFLDDFETRQTFTGPRGKAKCDFAIPNKKTARILIEAKGYGATGSKMTDVLGDIEKIIAAKRSDTALLFFTDGLSWKQRKSDLRKIIAYQNNGDITRIYTYSMAEQFEADLRRLKIEFNL